MCLFALASFLVHSCFVFMCSISFCFVSFRVVLFHHLSCLFVPHVRICTFSITLCRCTHTPVRGNATSTHHPCEPSHIGSGAIDARSNPTCAGARLSYLADSQFETCSRMIAHRYTMLRHVFLMANGHMHRHECAELTCALSLVTIGPRFTRAFKHN